MKPDKNIPASKNNNYQQLLSQISSAFVQGQKNAVLTDSYLIETYWKIGQYIVMRQFYQIFPISAELPLQLSWAQFVELLKIDNPLERSFNFNQTLNEILNITVYIYILKVWLY